MSELGYYSRRIAGYLCEVITNKSGIALGLSSEQNKKRIKTNRVSDV